MTRKEVELRLLLVCCNEEDWAAGCSLLPRCSESSRSDSERQIPLADTYTIHDPHVLATLQLQAQGKLGTMRAALSDRSFGLLLAGWGPGLLRAPERIAGIPGAERSRAEQSESSPGPRITRVSLERARYHCPRSRAHLDALLLAELLRQGVPEGQAVVFPEGQPLTAESRRKNRYEPLWLENEADEAQLLRLGGRASQLPRSLFGSDPSSQVGKSHDRSCPTESLAWQLS